MGRKKLFYECFKLPLLYVSLKDLIIKEVTIIQAAENLVYGTEQYFCNFERENKTDSWVTSQITWWIGISKGRSLWRDVYLSRCPVNSCPRSLGNLGREDVPTPEALVRCEKERDWGSSWLQDWELILPQGTWEEEKRETVILMRWLNIYLLGAVEMEADQDA